jgi:hypothetical protein
VAIRASVILYLTARRHIQKGQLNALLGPLQSSRFGVPGLESLDVHSFRLALSKGPSRVGVRLPSLEDGNRSGFRNVFSS